MKKYLFIIELLLASYAVVAQTYEKQKEEAPTQQELQDMMKELQDMMNDVSEEDKKEMEKMGVPMPDFNNLQQTVFGVSHDDLKKAFVNENRIVPEKDAERITSALANTLSNAGMSAYIIKTHHQGVLAKLSPSDKTKGAEVYSQLKGLNKSMANTAVGLWIDGKPTLAL